MIANFQCLLALFQSFPYILPTIIGGTVLAVGAILSCFLSWDGGVRGGRRIALAVEKNEPLAGASPAPGRHASPALSSRTAIRVPSVSLRRVLSPGQGEEDAARGAGYPELSRSAGGRRDSRASLGTAYGYGGIRSKHPTLAARAALEAARRASAAVGRPNESDEEDGEMGNRALKVAQKLLLANEENTFNINDLWVSAAVAQDTAVFDDEEETEDDQGDVDETAPDASFASPSLHALSPSTHDGHQGNLSFRRSSRARLTSMGNISLHRNLPGHRLSVSHGGRRFSTTSGHMPAIFSNTGVKTPPAVAAAYEAESPGHEADSFFRAASPSPDHGRGSAGGLSAIAEGSGGAVDSATADVATQIAEKEASSFSLLPVQVIIQVCSNNDSVRRKAYQSISIVWSSCFAQHYS